MAAGCYGAPLSLDLLPFETGVLVVSILGTTTIAADGRSHWLKGLVLLAAYLVIAAAFFFHEDRPDVSGGEPDAASGGAWSNKEALPGSHLAALTDDDDD